MLRGNLYPFYTTKSKGTGLSSEIIKKHDGQPRVRSSTGPARHGTVVSVLFPMAATQAA